jgi:hypothetical protein
LWKADNPLRIKRLIDFGRRIRNSHPNAAGFNQNPETLIVDGLSETEWFYIDSQLYTSMTMGNYTLYDIVVLGNVIPFAGFELTFQRKRVMATALLTFGLFIHPCFRAGWVQQVLPLDNFLEVFISEFTIGRMIDDDLAARGSCKPFV